MFENTCKINCIANKTKIRKIIYSVGLYFTARLRYNNCTSICKITYIKFINIRSHKYIIRITHARTDFTCTHVHTNIVRHKHAFDACTHAHTSLLTYFTL